MKDTDLIEAIWRRAENPETRTDMSRGRELIPPIYPRVSAAEIAEGERRLGFPLQRLHRRLFEEVGNGGFGPGDGIIGLPGGHGGFIGLPSDQWKHEGKTMIDLRQEMWVDAEHPDLPHGVVPLCDLGCARWLCIDELADEGVALVLDEFGLTDTGEDLRSCLADWANGVPVEERLFVAQEATVINPFTRRPMVVKGYGRAKGSPYKS
jgi:hypothetical protein